MSGQSLDLDKVLTMLGLRLLNIAEKDTLDKVWISFGLGSSLGNPWTMVHINTQAPMDS